MACNRCYQKSALDTYTNVSTTLVSGATLPLNVNYIHTGNSISHTAGSGTINLVKGGLYAISISATVAESGTAGNVSFQLYRNGIAVPAAIATVTSETTTDLETIGFTKLIRVDDVCCCAGNGQDAIPLTFINTGVGATYTNIQVTVVKLA